MPAPGRGSSALANSDVDTPSPRSPKRAMSRRSWGCWSQGGAVAQGALVLLSPLSLGWRVRAGKSSVESLGASGGLGALPVRGSPKAQIEKPYRNSFHVTLNLC